MSCCWFSAVYVPQMSHQHAISMMYSKTSSLRRSCVFAHAHRRNRNVRIVLTSDAAAALPLVNLAKLFY